MHGRNRTCPTASRCRSLLSYGYAQRRHTFQSTPSCDGHAQTEGLRHRLRAQNVHEMTIRVGTPMEHHAPHSPAKGHHGERVQCFSYPRNHLSKLLPPCKIRQLAKEGRKELTRGVKNMITEIPSQPPPIAREVCVALSARTQTIRGRRSQGRQP